MCGIAGFILQRPSPGVIDGMIESLAHRGPDGQMHCTIEMRNGIVVHLGHTRLAINDLSDAGQQPMTSADSRFTMTFNGEIYNYAELRRTCEQAGRTFASTMDGEVLLHLWDMYGPECLSMLNGIFALAVVDRDESTTWLARDPFGVKPLFAWTDSSGQMMFASEVATLIETGVPDQAPDVQALAQFLNFMWIPAPRTPYRDITSLAPGEVWTLRGDELSRKRFSRPANEAADDLADGACPSDPSRFAELFDQAVSRQMLSDVPVGIMASGGIDSSLIWASAPKELHIGYTIDWKDDATELASLDAIVAKEVAERLGREIRTVDPNVSIDRLRSRELFADAAFDLTYAIADRAHHDGLKVLLSGHGADEMLGGYRRHQAIAALGRLFSIPLARRPVASLFRRIPNRDSRRAEYGARLARAVSQPTLDDAYLTLCSYSTAEDRARILGTTIDEVNDDLVLAEHRAVLQSLPDGLDAVQRYRFLDTAVYMPGLGLAYADRAGMAASVEIRVPYLDLDLASWCLRLPASALTTSRTTKPIARSLAAQRCHPHVTSRPKGSFGAPADTLDRASNAEGDLGHRQSMYLQHAERMLEQFC